jgi:hypothetical protein
VELCIKALSDGSASLRQGCPANMEERTGPTAKTHTWPSPPARAVALDTPPETPRQIARHGLLRPLPLPLPLFDVAPSATRRWPAEQSLQAAVARDTPSASAGCAGHSSQQPARMRRRCATSLL